MKILEWLRRPKIKTEINHISNIPDKIWIKCEKCQKLIYYYNFEENLKVCPYCSYHHRLPAKERITQITDFGTFEEEDVNLTSKDILKFKDLKKYSVRLKETKYNTKLNEAVITGFCKIGGYNAGIAVMDFNFLGGSMGSCVGEKLVRTINKTKEKKLPIIIFCTSGGARMQEGILSLFQMAKVNCALSNFSSLYISVLCDPTTGGVAASFAYAGDIIIAEEDALIGFAGPRVIEQTTKLKLPDGFQRAEFLLQKGFVDIVVNRKKLKETIMKLLRFYYGK